jgi:hypothetical protein
VNLRCKNFLHIGGVFLSGVEIAATAFSNILKDTPVRPIGPHLFIAAHSPVRYPGSYSVSAFTHQSCSTKHCSALHPLCGEVFGFDRFQEVVLNSVALPAEAPLQETTVQLAAFMKGAPQQDGLTVILVAMEKDAEEKQEEHP